MKSLLYKIGFQIITKNIKYFIISILILTIGLTLFLSTSNSLSQLGYNYNQLKTDYNVEDFNFDSFEEIDKTKLHYLEDKYGIKIEKQKIKIVELKNKGIKSKWSLNEENKFTGFDKDGKYISKTISSDKYLLYIYENVKGTKIDKIWLDIPLSNNTMGFDQTHYNLRGYDSDSKLKIGDSEFNLVKAAFVNHVYPTLNLTMPDTKLISIATLNSSDFDKIKPDYYQNTYVGTFNNKNLSQVEKNSIYKKIVENTKVGTTQLIYKVTDRTINPNIATVEQKIVYSQSMTTFLALVITSIAILVVVFLITRLLKNSQVELGVLKSFGYRKSELIIMYIIFPIMVWLLASLLSILTSNYIGSYFLNLLLEFFSIPSKVISINVVGISITLLLTLIILLSVTIVLVYKILSNPTFDMMNGINKKDIEKNKFYYEYKWESKQTFVNRTKIFIMRTNKKIIAIFSFGFLVASILVYLALSYIGIFQVFTQGDLKYQNGNLITYEKKHAIKGKSSEVNLISGLITNSRSKNGKNQIVDNNFINILGLNKTKSNLILENILNDKQISLKNGQIAISNKLAVFHNLNIGDSISIQGTSSNKNIEYKISYIVKINQGLNVYMNNKDFNKDFNNNDQQYQIEISYDKPKYSKYSIVEKDKLLKTANNMLGVEFASITLMVSFAMLIAISLIWIITKQLIEDNKKIVEIMLLLGFSKKEIQKMVINSYSYFMYLISIITYPLFIWLFNKLLLSMAKSFNLVISLEFSFMYWIGGFGLLCTIYFVSTWISSRILNKSDISKISKIE